MSPTLYCVDDEPTNLLLLSNCLENYEVITFEGAKECIEQCRSQLPDLILLDVVMPEMGGIEACSTLKTDPQLKDIPVIFVSAKTDLESRLEGYSAGADDYLGKPYDPIEINTKVEKLLHRHQQVVSARHRLAENEEAMLALVENMGEMSSVIHFLRNTFNCRSYDDLAKAMIEAHQSLALEIAVEFRLPEGRKQYYFTGNIESPIEISAFDFIRTKGRLVPFGARTAVNTNSVSVIVRNMPIYDPDLNGRVRDHIALLAQGADSKIDAINADELTRKQYESLLHFAQQTRGLLDDFTIESDYMQDTSEDILSNIGAEIEESFIHLGLTDLQEEHQTKLIADAEIKMQQLRDSREVLTLKLKKIIEDMDEIVGQLEHPAETEPEKEEPVGDTFFF